MGQQYRNNWVVTLTAGITNVATTINVGAANAALLNTGVTISATNFVLVTIDDDADVEIVRVTLANGATGDLTVVRAQEGTTGVAFISGVLVETRTTKETLEALQPVPGTHGDNLLTKSDGVDTNKAQVTGIAVDDNNAMSGHGAAITAQTGTAYTLTAADNGKVVTFSNAAAITLTLPEDATETLPAGFQCAILQRGTGQVTVAAEGTDVIESKGSNLKLTGQHSSATVILLDQGTPNTWSLIGDLSA